MIFVGDMADNDRVDIWAKFALAFNEHMVYLQLAKWFTVEADCALFNINIQNFWKYLIWINISLWQGWHVKLDKPNYKPNMIIGKYKCRYLKCVQKVF